MMDQLQMLASSSIVGYRRGGCVEIAAVKRTTHKPLIEEADYFHEIISDDWFTLRPKKGGKKGRGK